MNTSKELKNLFDDLQMNAYNSDYHTYYYKEANQIIRKHFERFEKQVKVEPEVKPACETDKTQCKFCTRETTAEDFGFGKDRVCKSCLEKALANELRNMEQ